MSLSELLSQAQSDMSKLQELSELARFYLELETDWNGEISPALEDYSSGEASKKLAS